MSALLKTFRFKAPSRSRVSTSLVTTILVATSLVASTAIATPAVPTGTAQQSAEDYAQLLHFRYGNSPVTIPQGGVTLRRDTATWIFESGSVRLAEPTADGRITGLVFEGQGRFQMDIPDPVELRQFQRMAEDPNLARADTTFDEALIRTHEDLLATFVPDASHTGYEVSSTAKTRHEHWLVHRFEDVDARVIAGTRMADDAFLLVDMATKDHGRLTYAYDALASEEISVSHWNDTDDGYESWAQLDRAEDRLENGRPQSARRPLIDLAHVEASVDVTQAHKKVSRIGQAQFNPRAGQFNVEITFTPLEDGMRALPLGLSPLAELESIHDEGGAALPFLRDHIGGRSSAIDKLIHDNDVVVLFDEPLETGTPRTLRFVYEMMTLNYLPGGNWYPSPTDLFNDLHTGTFKVLSEDRFEILGMGEQVESSAEKGRKLTVLRVEEPTRMLTFAFADQRTQVQEMEKEGLPKVIAFGPSDEDQMWNVAADTLNSLDYFQQLFEQPIESETMYVTGILGGHGQSFEGFIHMGEFSMHYESTGNTEAFRAHEVAHQWWGHEVAWKSYRDQWLSEAFAEYAAMMFLEATMENGPKLYDEMVTAYVGSVTGVLKPTRMGAWMERNDKARKRIGPISVGYRASTAGSGGGYFGTTYQKGALVLHMLRKLLQNVTKSDDTFHKVLQRFLDDYAGQSASTDDFIATLTAIAPGDWQWFFDQWVHDTDIPTYAWSWKPGKKDGKDVIELTVEQKNVRPGFRMPVPVAITFGKDQVGQVIVPIDEARETFTIPVPSKPKRVELNPANTVVAVMKKL